MRPEHAVVLRPFALDFFLAALVYPFKRCILFGTSRHDFAVETEALLVRFARCERTLTRHACRQDRVEPARDHIIGKPRTCAPKLLPSLVFTKRAKARR